MNHIEEAQKLVEKINDALSAIKYNKKDYKESEVTFRLDSIEGMLIIARNDANDMLQFWKEEK